MPTEEEEEEDNVSPQEYVALSNFTGDGSDQVRETQTPRSLITTQFYGKVRGRGTISHCTVHVSQLSFSNGDRLLGHTKPSPQCWWAELHGVIGYVPASYLRQDVAEDEEDTSLEDPW